MIDYYVVNANGEVVRTGRITEMLVELQAINAGETAHKGEPPEGTVLHIEPDNEPTRIRKIKEKAEIMINQVAPIWKQLNIIRSQLSAGNPSVADKKLLDRIDKIRNDSNQAELDGLSPEEFNP